MSEQASDHVEKIVITVTLASGAQHTLVALDPGPDGDNPRFIAEQCRAGLDELGEKLDRLTEIYGSQIRPLPQLPR